MESAKSAGRMVGLLLLVHLVAGLMLPYILLKPAMASPSFIENAAANSVLVRATVFLFFASSALTVGVAITALTVFRKYSESLAR